MNFKASQQLHNTSGRTQALPASPSDAQRYPEALETACSFHRVPTLLLDTSLSPPKLDLRRSSWWSRCRTCSLAPGPRKPMPPSKREAFKAFIDSQMASSSLCIRLWRSFQEFHPHSLAQHLQLATRLTRVTLSQSSRKALFILRSSEATT